MIGLWASRQPTRGAAHGSAVGRLWSKPVYLEPDASAANAGALGCNDFAGFR